MQLNEDRHLISLRHRDAQRLVGKSGYAIRFVHKYKLVFEILLELLENAIAVFHIKI